jgi:hypothetical protein
MPQRFLTQGNSSALVEYQVGNPKVKGLNKSFSGRPPENYGGAENSSENSGPTWQKIFFASWRGFLSASPCLSRGNLRLGL